MAVGVTRNAWLIVLLGGIPAVVGARCLQTSASASILLLIQLFCLLAVTFAVATRKTPDRSGWWVLLASSALGMAPRGHLLPVELPGPASPFVSLGRYTLFVVGLILLLRVRRTRPNEQSLMDTGIVAVGLMVFCWAFVILPELANQPPQPQVTTLSFAALDLVMVAILVRVVVNASSRTAPILLMSVGGAALLATHVITVARIGPQALGNGNPDGMNYLAWQLCGVLVAAAALHPSSRVSPRAPDGSAAVVLPRRRLVLFVAVAVLAPVVPVIGLVNSGSQIASHDMPALVGSAALTCTVMLLLVLRLGNFARLAVRRADAIDLQSAAMLAQANALQRALDDQQVLQAELAHRALHDPLTGLANRTLLAERLVRMLGEPVRPSGGLLLLDLDGFKDVNDTLGHPVGDELLIQVAQRLTRVAGLSDIVARLGGDEFAMLMMDVDVARCRLTAWQVIETVREAYQLGERQPTVTSSAGLLILEPGRVDPTEALRDADLALYVAKQAGRNQVVEFDPSMREAHLRHAELAAGVRSAVDDNALRVHYQPIVDLASGRTVAVEALLRWRSHDGRRVTPSQFIAVAEDTGLIGSIGSEVLRDAATQASQWHGDHALSLSVNISGRQLTTPRFAAEVLAIISESGLPPGALIIEITETVLVDATGSMGPLAMRNLQTLRDHGVRIAVDDFGTGYSSLAYLQRLPIDILKIDQMFTSILESPGERGVRFVGAILGLGASLGLPTVAEGVETPRQAAMLRELGCAMAQGYHFARPCPADEVIDYFTTPVGTVPIDQ